MDQDRTKFRNLYEKADFLLKFGDPNSKEYQDVLTELGKIAKNDKFAQQVYNTLEDKRVENIIQDIAPVISNIKESLDEKLAKYQNLTKRDI